jgi:hypothetical protein
MKETKTQEAQAPVTTENHMSIWEARLLVEHSYVHEAIVEAIGEAQTSRLIGCIAEDHRGTVDQFACQLNAMWEHHALHILLEEDDDVDR